MLTLLLVGSVVKVTESFKRMIKEREVERASMVESLKLIVQSQLILADLLENQSRLEDLLKSLEQESQGNGRN